MHAYACVCVRVRVYVWEFNAVRVVIYTNTALTWFSGYPCGQCAMFFNMYGSVSYRICDNVQNKATGLVHYIV